MTTGIIVNDSVVAACHESVAEGTEAAPASATDGYFQPESDGVPAIISPKVEMKERNILTSGLIPAAARRGHYHPEGSTKVEVRGYGMEGSEPDYGILIESLMGTKHQVTAEVTTKSSGNTGTNLAIEDADISKFAVGDILIVKQSTEHSFQYVSAVATGAGSAALTVTPGRAAGSFSNSVKLSKTSTYKFADTGHKSFSLFNYLANEVILKALGCRTKSMSLDNYKAGEIPYLNFEYEGLTHSEANGAAGHTPTYGTALPPLVMSAKVYVDGTEVSVPEVSLKIDQPLTFVPSTASASGRVSGRATGKRSITGTIPLLKDDTSVAYYTALMAGTHYSLFLTAQNASSTGGEFEMGSGFAIYLPSIQIQEKSIGSLDGLLQDVLNFKADGGISGTSVMGSVAFI